MLAAETAATSFLATFGGPEGRHASVQNKSRQLEQASRTIQQLQTALQHSKAGLECAAAARPPCPSKLCMRFVGVTAVQGMLTVCLAPSSSYQVYMICLQGGAEAADVQDVLRSPTQLRCAAVHALLVLPQLYIEALCE